MGRRRVSISPATCILHSPICILQSFLPRFLVRRVFAFFLAEFLHFKPVGAARFLLRTVVARAADRAFEPDVFTHMPLPNQPQIPDRIQSEICNLKSAILTE